MASVSIVKLSEVKANGWRLDGEYWNSSDRLFFEKIRNTKHRKLSEFIDVLTDYHANGSYEILRENVKMTDEKDYSIMIRTTDLENNNFEENLKYISEHSYNFLQKTQLFGGEIIINKIGSPGLTYLMPNLNRPVSLGMNAFMIKSKNIKKEYIYVFLICKYGKLLIEQQINGTVPLSLSKDGVRNILIPDTSHTFQTKIEETVKKAHELLEASKTAYKQAEEMLLAEVFGNWKPAKHKNWHVKMLSQVQSAGRMDAEYFHAKYEDLLAQIKSYKGGWCELGEAFSQNKTTKNTKENEIYKYVEIGSVDTSSGEIIPLNIEGKDLPANAKIDLQIGNVIVSTVRSYRGAVGIVQENDMIGSGAFTVLQENSNFKKEALFVILRTALYKDFSQKFATGMSYPVITDGDVLNFPLPLLPQILQTEIAQLVKQSFEDRTQSKKLLEFAKTAIEKAIEEGEEVGIKELKNAQ